MYVTVFALVLVLLLSPTATGKGSGGATSGGSYRSSRSGHYSRTSRYYYYPIFFHGGAAYSGRRRSSSGTSGDHQSSFNAGDNAVFCKRKVELDKKTYAGGDTIAINSTRQCYNQVSTTLGAPENTPLLDIFLDVYRFELSAKSGEPVVVKMWLYEDKDYNTPKNWWGVSLDSITEGALPQVQLSTLTWSVHEPALKGTTAMWGYPRQYFLDEAKLTSLSLRGKNANTDIIFTFTLSDDFAEDPDHLYMFLRPSAMRVTVTLLQYEFSTSNGELGLSATIAAKGSPVFSPANPPSGKHGTEYDPRAMRRIEIGTINDQQNYGRNYFSYHANFATSRLCMSSVGLGCTYERRDMCNNNATLCSACSAGQCPWFEATASNFTAKQITFSSRKYTKSKLFETGPKWSEDGMPGSKQLSHLPRIMWSFNMGTFDDAERVAAVPESASKLAMAPLLALVVLCVALL